MERRAVVGFVVGFAVVEAVQISTVLTQGGPPGSIAIIPL
jgi:hypothetical protein